MHNVDDVTNKFGVDDKNFGGESDAKSEKNLLNEKLDIMNLKGHERPNKTTGVL